MMIQLYLLGTTHSSKKSKKQIKKIFKNFKIDAILSEGVTGKLRINDWIKEPFLSIFTEIYSFYLEKKGSEFELLKEIANKNKIPFKNIDMTLHELIDYFHKWYNYILFVGIFLMVITVFKRTVLTIHILLTFSIYAFYFVSKTFSIRNKSFVEKTENLIKNKNYKKILIICGKHHRKVMKDNFKNIIDLTSDI